MNLQQEFEAAGALFVSTEQELKAKLEHVRCFIFDWDGVFNNGTKTNSEGSPFSEPDSMGLNMLRFSFWLKHGTLPFVAIITGENNLTAQKFAQREHLDAVMLKTKDKATALKALTAENGYTPDQCAFVFDDILDLGVCEISKAAFCIKRESSPLFNDFVVRQKLCDYISAATGGQHAVREVCELLIGLNGNFDEVVQKRMRFHEDYKNYLELRNQI